MVIFLFSGWWFKWLTPANLVGTLCSIGIEWGKNYEIISCCQRDATFDVNESNILQLYPGHCGLLRGPHNYSSSVLMTRPVKLGYAGQAQLAKFRVINPVAPINLMASRAALRQSGSICLHKRPVLWYKRDILKNIMALTARQNIDGLGAILIEIQKSFEINK